MQPCTEDPALIKQTFDVSGEYHIYEFTGIFGEVFFVLKQF